MSTSNITLYITQFSLKNKIFITFSNIPKVKNICVCVCLHICVCLPITSIGEREKLIVEQYLSTLLKGHYPLVQNQGNVGLFHRYCSIHCSSIHCFLSNAGQEKPFFINKYLSKIKEKHFFSPQIQVLLHLLLLKVRSDKVFTIEKAIWDHA